MTQEPYASLNDAWKSTSKILFGQEIGDLDQFEDYLSPAAEGRFVNSSFSGKNVWVASKEYSLNSRFFDYEKELAEFRSMSSTPLDINKIKDIDSLREAIKEKFIYAGNKVLGNSKYTKDSDAIIDSTFVLNSSVLIKSKYVAYSYLLQNSEYSFASMSTGQSGHIIRCFYNNSLRRCFETSTSVTLSDSYYCYNLIGCSDCLFSFNLRSKRNTIGNIELEKSTYNELKKKLVSEIAEDLKSKKKTLSIIDMIGEEA